MRLLHELLPELLQARGWKVSDLSEATAKHGYIKEATLDTYVDPGNAGRVPDAAILQSIAKALDVKPVDFYEWPIAVARRDRPTTREAKAEARARLRRRLAAKGSPGGGRREAAPDTSPAPPDPAGEAT